MQTKIARHTTAKIWFYNTYGGQACKPDFVQHIGFDAGALWRSFL